MAVFTPLTHNQIENVLRDYSIGSLVEFEGILQGVDNTNYKIKTTNGKYILTIFESRIDPNDIPFFLNFMSHLKTNGIVCPQPILLSSLPESRRDSKAIQNMDSPRIDAVNSGNDGNCVSFINDKPACIFTFLEGNNLTQGDITPALCGELGTLLARLHIAGQSFAQSRVNSMGYNAWTTRIHKVGPQANTIMPNLENLLNTELDFLKTHWPEHLPVGNIHADLFPDNVFQKDGHLYGVIDFYFAATDYLAYDLAIVMNAWCFADGKLNIERWNALHTSYENVRPLSAQEKESFHIMARGAAMRFIASRLYDLVFHDTKNQVTPKNPMEYIKILKYHMNNKVF